MKYFGSTFFKCSVLLVLVLRLSACQESDNSSSHSPLKHGPPDALPVLESLTFELAGESVDIEIAYTKTEQQQGLMYRKSMPDHHGMLFVYDQPRFMSFWMFNTRLPLSIAYIRDNGTISNIEAMEPLLGMNEPYQTRYPSNPAHYMSKYKSRYALEMNLGWFEKHGFKAGDSIQLPIDKIETMIAAKK